MDIKMVDVFGSSLIDNPAKRLASSMVLIGPDKDAAILAISQHDNLVNQVRSLRDALNSIRHYCCDVQDGFEISEEHIEILEIVNDAIEVAGNYDY